MTRHRLPSDHEEAERILAAQGGWPISTIAAALRQRVREHISWREERGRSAARVTTSQADDTPLTSRHLHLAAGERAPFPSPSSSPAPIAGSPPAAATYGG